MYPDDDHGCYCYDDFYLCYLVVVFDHLLISFRHVIDFLTLNVNHDLDRDDDHDHDGDDLCLVVVFDRLSVSFRPVIGNDFLNVPCFFFFLEES